VWHSSGAERRGEEAIMYVVRWEKWNMEGGVLRDYSEIRERTLKEEVFSSPMMDGRDEDWGEDDGVRGYFGGLRLYNMCKLQAKTSRGTM